MSSEEQITTRRTVLAASGSATVVGLAGCITGGDDDDGTEASEGGDDASEADTSGDTDDGEATEPTETVTLLVENVGGGHDHNEEDEPDEDEHEGLTETELGHACTHLEEIEEFGAEEIDGGASVEEASHLTETHHPYSVAVDNGSAYVRFETESEEDHDQEHDHEESDNEFLACFIQGGSASVASGELVYSETEDIASCDSIDRYILVEPDHGEAVVELSSEL